MKLILMAALAMAAEEAAVADDGATAPGPADGIRAEAAAFLDVYNSMYRSLATVSSEANWRASTDVKPLNEGLRTGADQAWMAFVGAPAVVAKARALLDRADALDPLQARQLRQVLFEAGDAPGDRPDLVARRVAAESALASVQDGFVYCVDRAADGSCPEPLTAVDLDARMAGERDLDRRLAIWRAGKEEGRAIKPGLVELRDLRNEVARAMGYSSFFALQVAPYGMTADEMMAMLDGFVADMQPVYAPLHRWTARRLAERYGQPVPEEGIPAHWFDNRWAQEWGGLVPSMDLDALFADRGAERIVRDAEAFYVDLGFEPLPASFWEKSDLYPAPADGDRRKNTHASAWHVDLDRDVRVLMNARSDADTWFTAHHELGHVYYFLSYSRPEVPMVLRRGANRAFHEGIGEFAAMLAGRPAYLRERGLPVPRRQDRTAALLDEALVQTVAFLPFSVAVSRFEYELYEKDLPPDRWQSRWWEIVGELQGVVPPTPERAADPALCDACTKTHLVDDPAAYYDYTIATVLKYQLYQHVADTWLRRGSPRLADHPEIGTWLRGILEKGGTEDWRVVLREATGSDLTTRPMVEYFRPLVRWLDRHGGGE